MLIGYSRVSTLDQTPALQIDALTSAGCDKIFTEKASGAKRDRPELKVAIDYLRKGDTLVVWKLDRLARSVSQLVQTLDELNARGIAFRSLTEQIDTNTATGRLVFHVIAAIAEFERTLIQERVVAGLAVARKNGKKGGRPRSISKKNLEVAEGLLKDTTMSVADIAETQGMSLATLYRYFPKGREGLKGGHDTAEEADALSD